MKLEQAEKRLSDLVGDRAQFTLEDYVIARHGMTANETIEQALIRMWPHKVDNTAITTLFADETAKHAAREEAESKSIAQEQERIARAALKKAGKL